ncbi:MAG: winged helix-turn-helix domain-containing protein [Candidatus Heimdallarchaeaceae archaeon]
MKAKTTKKVDSMPVINRTRYDIYADILEVLQFYTEAGISQIARRANLPIDRAKGIIQFMLARGLIVKYENSEKRPKFIYRATNKGSEYAALYKEMSRIVVEITEDEFDIIPEY